MITSDAGVLQPKEPRERQRVAEIAAWLDRNCGRELVGDPRAIGNRHARPMSTFEISVSSAAAGGTRTSVVPGAEWHLLALQLEKLSTSATMW